MGVPPKIGFFFLGFEVTYPLIFKGSEAFKIPGGRLGEEMDLARWA
jgi:hypothetical protein